MSQAGLPTPESLVIHMDADLEKAAKIVGFPAVIKPISGAGSMGVIKVTDLEDLQRRVSSYTALDLPPPPYLPRLQAGRPKWLGHHNLRKSIVRNWRSLPRHLVACRTFKKVQKEIAGFGVASDGSVHYEEDKSGKTEAVSSCSTLTLHCTHVLLYGTWRCIG